MTDKPCTQIAYRITTHDGDDCRGWTPRPGWEELAAWMDDSEDHSDYPALLDFEDGVAIFFERQTINDEVGVAVGGTDYSAEQLADALAVGDDMYDFEVIAQKYDLDAAQEFIAWTFVPVKE